MALNYHDLKWLQEVSETLDKNTYVRDFVLLIAQDHPDIFHHTVDRVESGNFEVEKVELEIRSGRTMYVQGGVGADLTRREYNALRSWWPDKKAIAQKLCLYLPHLTHDEAMQWAEGMDI